jgi:hypothetical protein
MRYGFRSNHAYAVIDEFGVVRPGSIFNAEAMGVIRVDSA